MLRQHILQRLFLVLFLFVSAVLLRSNAALRNSEGVTGWIGKAMTGPKQFLRTDITGASPNILPRKAGTKYVCEMENADKQKDLKTDTLSHVNSCHNNFIFDKTVVGDNNKVLCVSGKDPNLCVSNSSLKDIRKNVSVVSPNLLDLNIMPDEDTVATLNAVYPYYGMELSVKTNLPPQYTGVYYLLIDAREKCQHITTVCDPKDGCYLLRGVYRLPPPGTYYLCLTAYAWKNQHLPWGHSPIEVKSLVLSPLSFSNEVAPSINLYDGNTHSAVEMGHLEIYISRWNPNIFPLKKSQKGDKIVDMIVCYYTSPADREPVLNTPLRSQPGVYALCISDGKRSASAAAFPIRVMKKPFTMRVIGDSDSFVKVNVSGGDIGKREKPYEVCVVERGASCTSVTLDSHCTRSSNLNVDSVHVDVTSLASGKVTFCLVVGMFTHNGHVYMDIQGEMSYVIKGRETNVWILVVIAISIITLPSFVVGIVCCLRNRKAEDEGTVFSED